MDKRERGQKEMPNVDSAFSCYNLHPATPEVKFQQICHFFLDKDNTLDLLSTYQLFAYFLSLTLTRWHQPSVVQLLFPHEITILLTILNILHRCDMLLPGILSIILHKAALSLKKMGVDSPHVKYWDFYLWKIQADKMCMASDVTHLTS